MRTDIPLIVAEVIRDNKVSATRYFEDQNALDEFIESINDDPETDIQDVLAAVMWIQ